jgi:hypothetical protein
MKRVILPCATALLFASCVPSTPEARIAAGPERFAALPPRQQELVRQGRIEKGMGRDAVLIAWGRPSREYEGSEGGVPTLRWDYTGTTPVYQSGYYGGYAYGYGRRSYYDFAIVPEITYVPYRRATVLFRDGRVESWERSR